MKFFTSFIALAVWLFGTSIYAQSTYSVYGPCSTINHSDELDLLATSGDRLIFEDRDADFNYHLMMVDGVASGGADTLFTKRGRFLLQINSDTLLAFSIDRNLYELKPQDSLPRLIFTAPDNVAVATRWNGAYYFAYEQFSDTRDNILVRLADGESTTTEVTVVKNGSVDIIAPLPETLIIVGESGSTSFISRTDGTVAGTAEVTTLYTERNQTSGGDPTDIVVAGDKLFFFYNNPPDNGNRGLWVTDGTAAGSLELGNYQTDRFNAAIDPLAFEGNLYYSMRRVGAPSGTTYDFFRSDGTLAGTQKLNTSNSYINASSATVFGEYLYFTGSLGFRRTNASIATSEAALQGDRQPGEISTVARVAAFNDSLLLNATIPFNNFEPFLSDGSYANSRQLTEIDEDPEDGGFPQDFTVSENRAYFFAEDGNRRMQVYAYDLTAAAGFGQPIMVDSVAVEMTSDVTGDISIRATGSDLSYELNGEMNITGVFTGLFADTYSYTITDAFGCTLTDSVTVDSEVAVRELSVQGEYHLWPNPVKGGEDLMLARKVAGKETITSVSLFDLAGRQLFSQHQTARISAPTVKGTYLLVGHDERGRAIARWRVIVR